jgi:hypothetical protein
MHVVLDDAEIAELDKQDPTTAGDGGFQNFMVQLQQRIERATGRLFLSAEDVERIQRYAFKYGNAGWEDRLLAAFGRHLGPRLNGVSAAIA